MLCGSAVSDSQRMGGDRLIGLLLGSGMLALGGMLLKYRRRAYPFLYGWFGRDSRDIPDQFRLSFFASICFLIVVGAYACVQSVRGWD
jgi:hypothetical protein